MKRLLTGACLLALWPLGLASAFAEGEAGEKPPFSCTITSAQTRITEGQEPKINVAIRNDSGKEAVLVGSLDGCARGGGRFPRCGFEVLDTAGKPVQLQALGRCGNQNSLRIEDFATVAAGADFNPFGKGFFGSADPIRMSFLPPGTYRVHFTYQTSAGSIVDYMGDDRAGGEAKADPKLKELHKTVPVVDLKSNDLTFTIVPRKASPAPAKAKDAAKPASR
ncbi:hypothetical protein [Luteolibacter soli]|uniref:DUF2135 domain-containing protein n=1 Tax=Luteolibacter soli TaxID=3135280 RepID=A0ABU9AWF2_9BACT